MPSFREHVETLERWRRLPAVESAPADSRAFCLTFDDGPDPDGTPAVLDALDATGARATFFMLGEQAEANRALAREVATRGHEVALHGHGHEHHDRLAPGAGREDLRRGREAVAAATGAEPRLYRPPYGLFSDETHAACAELGLRPVYWSVWGMDWEPIDAERIADLVTRDIAPGAICLLHDSPRYAPRPSAQPTADALSAICQAARAAGLSLVPVSQALPEETERTPKTEDRTPETASVRPATQADVDSIASIHAAGFADAYAGRVPPGHLAQRGPAQRRELWQTVLDSPAPRSHLLVAEAGDEVIGFLSCGPSRDVDAAPASEAQISTLYVAEAHRGTGAARALIEASLARSAREGFKEVTLWTVPENERAVAFYERAGFERDGAERSGRGGIPVTEHRMRRALG